MYGTSSLLLARVRDKRNDGWESGGLAVRVRSTQLVVWPRPRPSTTQCHFPHNEDGWEEVTSYLSTSQEKKKKRKEIVKWPVVGEYFENRHFKVLVIFELKNSQEGYNTHKYVIHVSLPYN